MIEMAEVYAPLLTERHRYKVFWGGRGAARSWSFGRALLTRAMSEKIRILCTREYQKSIRESVHHLLRSQIMKLGLRHSFDVQRDVIRSRTGSEFIFDGLHLNVETIMSMEDIDICWMEQGEKTSQHSWEILIPTIRNPGSEIWVSFNPFLPTDPTAKKFLNDAHPDALVRKTSWRDNPWFPDVLRKEKDHLWRVDPDAGAHIWDGEFRTSSDAQILHGKCVVEAFEPGEDWDGPYYGADWGFSQDPTTLIKMWIHQGRLYIEYESWAIGLEIVDTAARWKRDVPGCESGIIRADNARPETISHVKRDGLNIKAARKWPGCVEDGIAFLRGFEHIVIHPRCNHFEQETRLYSYKEDRLTGDILTAIVDKHNHCLDASRYGLDPMIKAPPRAVMV
ncbi:MAG: PBSX family phage terminase large subunit [Sphingomonadales bacterium]